jgi:hypothetical protein
MSTATPPEAARESYRSNGVCRAGAMGGARVVCPRQMRMASTTLGWAIAEMISAFPPHLSQSRTSSRKERCSYCTSRNGCVGLAFRAPGFST